MLMLMWLIFRFAFVVDGVVCVHVDDLDDDVILVGFIVGVVDVLGLDCDVLDVVDGVVVDVDMVGSVLYLMLLLMVLLMSIVLVYVLMSMFLMLL